MQLSCHIAPENITATSPPFTPVDIGNSPRTAATEICLDWALLWHFAGKAKVGDKLRSHGEEHHGPHSHAAEQCRHCRDRWQLSLVLLESSSSCCFPDPFATGGGLEHLLLEVIVPGLWSHFQRNKWWQKWWDWIRKWKVQKKLHQNLTISKKSQRPAQQAAERERALERPCWDKSCYLPRCLLFQSSISNPTALTQLPQLSSPGSSALQPGFLLAFAASKKLHLPSLHGLGVGKFVGQCNTGAWRVLEILDKLSFCCTGGGLCKTH